MFPTCSNLVRKLIFYERHPLYKNMIVMQVPAARAGLVYLCCRAPVLWRLLLCAACAWLCPGDSFGNMCVRRQEGGRLLACLLACLLALLARSLAFQEASRTASSGGLHSYRQRRVIW